jgi:hypothetical protein
MTVTDQTQAFLAVTDATTKATHTHVVLADGTQFVVRSGQTRDLIAWDKLMSRKFDRAAQVFVFAAFLAYQGATREGFFTGTFDAFTDQLEDMSPVRPADDPAELAEEPVPPTTRTAPPA